MTDKTPTEVAAVWAKRLKASTMEMEAGAKRVTEAPSAAAIRNKAKMKARLIAAIDDGTWERMLGKYGLEDWKKDFVDVGIPRVSSGVDNAKAKSEEFYNWLLPHVTAGQNIVKVMPDVTLDDNIARMVKMTRHMASKKYKG